MSDEGSGSIETGGLQIEKREFGDHDKSNNVAKQLRVIRDRENPVTRFDGFEIIRADRRDLDARADAGEDKAAIKQEKAKLIPINGWLAKIDSEYAHELLPKEQNAVTEYIEAKRTDWENMLEKDPKNAEAQENINVYNALISDIRKHLPKNDAEEAGESKEATEKAYDEPTLKEKLTEVPQLLYKPIRAAEELKKLEKRELTDIADVEAYFAAQREDFETIQRANPSWERYEPAAAAFIKYFKDPEHKGENSYQPFVITIQPDNKKIDVRPMDGPQIETVEGSEQFIIDRERDASVLEQVAQFEPYDAITKDAKTGIEKLKQNPPLSITHAEHDALVQLIVSHRKYIANYQIDRAVQDGSTINAIDQLVNSAILAGSVKN